MLDQEYLNSYDWILVVQLWDTLWNYNNCDTVYEIDFFLHVKLLPECRKTMKL